MNREYREPLGQLLSAYGSGQSLALLFDYDGTLAPLVAHPRLAQLAPRTRSLLQRLARLPRVAVGVISGRRIDDLKRMVGIPGLYYSGTSGLELELRSASLAHPRCEEGHRMVIQAARQLSALARCYPGAWIEQKPLGLTLHFRNVAPFLVRDLCRQARQIFRPSVDCWRLVDGPMALEVIPALGWTKASAVRMILLEVGAKAVPLYAGDDNNDADALETVRGMEGVAIGIGHRAPQTAGYLFAGPAVLQRFLVQLLANLDRQPCRLLSGRDVARRI